MAETSRLLSVAALLGLVAGPLAAQQVREIQVNPGQVEIEAGGRQTVVVTAYDPAGNTIPGVDFSWSGGENIVSLERDASVAGFLHVSGLMEGAATVRIVSGSASANLVVSVGGSGGPSGSGPAAIMNIEPGTIYLLPTEEVQLTAVFLRADGQLASRQRVAWSSLYEPTATVNASGRVIGIGQGQGVILAETQRGLSARALVHVINSPISFAGSKMSLSPLGVDTIQVVVPSQSNRPVSNRMLRYATTNPAVAAVTPLGVVNAIQMGDARIIVQGFGQQIELPVSVHRPVQTMLVSPLAQDITVPVSGSRPVTARFEAADGTPVTEAEASWQVADPSIASFDPATGAITGNTPGTTTLNASGPGPGLVYEWTVNVIQGAIQLDLERVGLMPGETRAVNAVFVDEDGTELGPVQGMGWQSQNIAVATVNENGVVTAVGPGRTQVSGIASWGDTRSVDVIVQGPLLVTSDRGGSADIYAVRIDSLDSGQRLTSDPGTEIAASYSPDGFRIVYVSHQGTNSEIVVADADGTNATQITTTTVDEGTPSFTPDGSSIVYSVVTPGVDGSVSDIGIMNADGSASVVLTDATARRDDPAVSPDGTLIAFRSNEAGGRNIYVMGMDGSNARPVTQEETSAGSPRWFGAGMLGFVSRRRSESSNNMVQVVMRADVSTGAMEQVTPDSLAVAEFDVLPGGSLALVIETRERDMISRKLFVQRSDGSLEEVPRVSELEQFLTPRARR